MRGPNKGPKQSIKVFYMPSSEKFRDYVLQQFKGELRVTTRKMMGEYILYADGKIFGGIYDDRLLVKPVAAALAMLPGAKKQLPYDGAKPMLRVTNEQIEDSGLLVRLLDAMLPELPAPAKNKRRIVVSPYYTCHAALDAASPFLMKPANRPIE